MYNQSAITSTVEEPKSLSATPYFRLLCVVLRIRLHMFELDRKETLKVRIKYGMQFEAYTNAICVTHATWWPRRICGALRQCRVIERDRNTPSTSYHVAPYSGTLPEPDTR